MKGERMRNYQKESYTNIQPHIDQKDEVLNWCIGLAEEVGETFNHIKHCFYGNEELNKEEISKEIGDCLWYLSALCSSLNIDLKTVAQLNLEKLKFRFQKNEFSEEESKNRKKSDVKFKDTVLYKNLIKELDYDLHINRM